MPDHALNKKLTVACAALNCPWVHVLAKRIDIVPRHIGNAGKRGACSIIEGKIVIPAADRSRWPVVDRYGCGARPLKHNTRGHGKANAGCGARESVGSGWEVADAAAHAVNVRNAGVERRRAVCCSCLIGMREMRACRHVILRRGVIAAPWHAETECI